MWGSHKGVVRGRDGWNGQRGKQSQGVDVLMRRDKKLGGTRGYTYVQHREQGGVNAK